jgi:hypothetical protein
LRTDLVSRNTAVSIFKLYSNYLSWRLRHVPPKCRWLPDYAASHPRKSQSSWGYLFIALSYAFVAYLKAKHSSVLLEASKHSLENFSSEGVDMTSRLPRWFFTSLTDSKMPIICGRNLVVIWRFSCESIQGSLVCAGVCHTIWIWSVDLFETYSSRKSIFKHLELSYYYQTLIFHTE